MVLHSGYTGPSHRLLSGHPVLTVAYTCAVHRPTQILHKLSTCPVRTLGTKAQLLLPHDFFPRVCALYSPTISILFHGLLLPKCAQKLSNVLFFSRESQRSTKENRNGNSSFSLCRVFLEGAENSRVFSLCRVVLEGAENSHVCVAIIWKARCETNSRRSQQHTMGWVSHLASAYKQFGERRLNFVATVCLGDRHTISGNPYLQEVLCPFG